MLNCKRIPMYVYGWSLRDVIHYLPFSQYCFCGVINCGLGKVAIWSIANPRCF